MKIEKKKKYVVLIRGVWVLVPQRSVPKEREPTADSGFLRTQNAKYHASSNSYEPAVGSRSWEPETDTPTREYDWIFPICIACTHSFPTCGMRRVLSSRFSTYSFPRCNMTLVFSSFFQQIFFMHAIYIVVFSFFSYRYDKSPINFALYSRDGF